MSQRSSFELDEEKTSARKRKREKERHRGTERETTVEFIYLDWYSTNNAMKEGNGKLNDDYENAEK